MAGMAQAADKPLAGVTLNLASMNDQFSAVLAQIAPKFKEATGAEIKVDIMDYGSLLTKTTADFVVTRRAMILSPWTSSGPASLPPMAIRSI